MNKLVDVSEDKPYNWLRYGRITAPVYAYIEVTNRCNSNCLYCQIPTNTPCERSDMPFLDFCSYLQQLNDINIMEIRLGGGEPLLHGDILKMVDLISHYGMNSWLCTNGYLLHLKDAFALKSAGLFGVRVSLDSTNIRVNNYLRGNANAWHNALRAVACAHTAGLKVVISMTVTNDNIDDINRMKILSSNLDARLNLHPVMPAGKGKIVSTIDMAPVSENEIIEACVNETSEESICMAANGFLTISFKGEVSPCTFIEPIASLSDYSLLDILQSEKYKKYMSIVPQNHCTGCKFECTKSINRCLLYPMCKGGCWALYEKSRDPSD